MKRFFQFVTFIILLPILLTLRLMPLKAAEYCGRKLVGSLGPHIRTQKTVLKNIAIVFPNNTVEENIILSKKVWKHIGMNLAQSLQMDNKKLISDTTITGLSHLQKAHKKGNGVLLLSAHIGVWDCVIINVADKVAPCDVVYRPIENPYLNSWIKKFRLNVFNKLIVKSDNAGREILRSLKRGAIVPMLSDQKMWGHTRVPFFGKDAECADGAVRMAYKTKTPIIPVYTISTAHGYELIIEPEMKLTGDLNTDIIAMNAIFERWITQYPEQYFNFTHKKWDD